MNYNPDLYIKQLEERCELLEVQCEAQRKIIAVQIDTLKYDINPKLSSEIEYQIKTRSNSILKYYPWGKETSYNVLGSTFILDTMEENHPTFYKNKNDWQLVAEITQEVNRACKYLSTDSLFFSNNPEEVDSFHRQRVNAFVYAHLLVNGFSELVKDSEFEKRERPLFTKEFSSDIRINYTRQELCAIYLIIVLGEFENLC